MSDEKDLDLLLQDIISLSKDPDGKFYGTGLWGKCHTLADAHDLPAKEFFIQKLDDSRWTWRRESVRLLGFHYHLEEEVVEKIRKLLLHDPDAGVRISCASVLGVQSAFTDDAMLFALENDTEPLVREAAFYSILDLVKIPYRKIQQEIKKIRSGEIEPNLGEIMRIMAEEGKT